MALSHLILHLATTACLVTQAVMMLLDALCLPFDFIMSLSCFFVSTSKPAFYTLAASSFSDLISSS